ncbi:hypothetical protein [Lactococcus allomyrinae]|uniref:Uncharacterized protein n=1 Tax=Lactococcus allomyrinae TaxID=2419773 RepID=A0A387BPF9_9LACT|nr:hypothetical protein [Lactococcus allomyrinae]AYG00411.1 hypothetical protein D7I46_04480 [Lactococcus allomyrinae]
MNFTRQQWNLKDKKDLLELLPTENSLSTQFNNTESKTMSALVESEKLPIINDKIMELTKVQSCSLTKV